jgi:type III secretory pathway lipoprotein EscJ
MVNLRNNRWRRYGASFFLLALIALLTACGESPIAETDDEYEAIRMFDILYSNRLHVKKTPEKTGEKSVWKISIDEGLFGDGEAAWAIQVLNDHGLPRPKDSLPPPSNAYGMESQEEAKKRQNREKEIQLENQLYTTLPGVIIVKVTIAQPVNDILSIEKTLPTASVSIVQTEPEAKFAIENVQSAVAGGVANLKPGNVTVVVTHKPLREIPRERLEEQRKRNMNFALGSGLIILLIAALAAVWYAVKRRKKQVEPEPKQLTETSEPAEIEANEQYALNSADEDNF